jgi:hypothetical protein
MFSYQLFAEFATMLNMADQFLCRTFAAFFSGMEPQESFFQTFGSMTPMNFLSF